MGWGSGVDRGLQHGAGGTAHCIRPRQVFRGLGVRVGQGDGLQARWAGTRKQVGRRRHGRRRPHHPVPRCSSSGGGEIERGGQDLAV